jgi:hypothetical protein
MKAAGSPTVREAQARFYVVNELARAGDSSARYWILKFAGLSLPVPNFAWRRKALPLHDLHHLLTGYPCSPSGEFEMAAWEFAAGRYRNVFATAFCLPLVGIGGIACPRRTFRAFVRGRASRTLYAQGEPGSEVLDGPLDALRNRLMPAHTPQARLRDVFTYAGLLLISLTWTLAPFVALCGWILLP